MKKVLSLVIVLVLVLSLFAGCSEDKGRVLYNVDLEDYVELGEYKGIKVDKESDEFAQMVTAQILNDVISKNFHSTESIKKGIVNAGDIANIDYIGKKDGIAFEGGTAKNYDLTIGSGSFISGFEEGLVGKKIGSTVDLNLTFPADYQSAELAGKDVVFTVKINSVKPAKTPEEFYTALGYANVDAYYQKVEEDVIDGLLAQKVIEKCKVNEYCQEDMDILFNHYYSIEKENIEKNFQCTMAEYLAKNGITEETYSEYFKTQLIKPLMEQQMVWYAIFDKEKMTFSKEDTENKIKEIIAINGDTSVTRADIIEDYGELYIESLVVSDKVFEFLKDNAEIK